MYTLHHGRRDKPIQPERSLSLRAIKSKSRISVLSGKMQKAVSPKFSQHCKCFPQKNYSKASGKVQSLLEVCFILILGSSLHMKIPIMSGKITEDLEF